MKHQKNQRHREQQTENRRQDDPASRLVALPDSFPDGIAIAFLLLKTGFLPGLFTRLLFGNVAKQIFFLAALSFFLLQAGLLLGFAPGLFFGLAAGLRFGFAAGLLLGLAPGSFPGFADGLLFRLQTRSLLHFLDQFAGASVSLPASAGDIGTQPPGRVIHSVARICVGIFVRQVFRLAGVILVLKTRLPGVDFGHCFVIVAPTVRDFSKVASGDEIGKGGCDPFLLA
ncbi:MAG: hypothetical protein Q8O52_23065 [Sulfuritalea sp.]|nr:hypothetical protein [Sulfuritalea sp.]